MGQVAVDALHGTLFKRAGEVLPAGIELLGQLYRGEGRVLIVSLQVGHGTLHQNVGAAGGRGLSAAGGGDFYYEDKDSYRKYFRPFAEKYHFKGAFAGMMHPWKTREEYWGYLATFLHTTQTAPVRHSYLDLDALLKGKDFFILTTNQDTQFVKLYPDSLVICLKVSFASSELLARPCTMMAEDCVPTFPPVPPISGM